MPTIAPCLWMDKQGEEAANFYVSIFPNSRITNITRYGDVGQEIHGGKPGEVLTVEFELDGQPFTTLNGAPLFQFSEAISFQIDAPTQDKIDSFWDKLTADGGEPSQCGWLKDKYGVSWQVFPFQLSRELFGNPNGPKSQRAFSAMMGMTKIDIAALQKAYEG